MNRDLVRNALIALLGIVVVFLYMKTATALRLSEESAGAQAQLRDSLRLASESIDSLKALVPGLGEFMTSMQLHAAKLAYAEEHGNWPLADYELHELGEAIETAEALHAVKNNVNISAVLQSVANTQVPALGMAVAKKRPVMFAGAYAQTLAACNACHKAAGYEFIHIVPPMREPVSNQQWTPQSK